MANALYFVILIGGSVISFLVLRLLLTEASNDTELELQILLKDFHLEEYETYIKESGCKSAVSFIRMVENNYKDDSSHPVSFLRENILRESIQPQVSRIKHYLVFKHWLKKQGLENAVPRFINLGALSLKEVQNIDHFELKRQLSQREFSLWKQASRELPYTEADQYELIKKLWFEIEREREPWTSVGLFVLTLVLALSLGVVVSMSRTSNLVNHYVAPSKRGFLSFVTGRYLSPHKCKVSFDWEDPHVVGSTMSFTVKFVQRNGHPYPICNEDNVLIEVTQDSHKIACSIELGGLQIAEANKAKVQFTVRRAGEYRISILVDMIPIKGSPFVKTFLPGSADPLKTCFVNHCSTVVGSEGIPTQLFIEPRDRYSNHCTIDSDADPSDEYCVDVTEATSGRPIPDSFHWERYPPVSRLALVLKFPKEGCYRATVSYKGTTIQNGDFHIIILNKEEVYLVQKNVAKKNKCYEVKLLSLNGESSTKPKKVYCYISPKDFMYGKMLHKTGNNTTGKSQANTRRSLVFRFLGGCSASELKMFFDLVFMPFHELLIEDTLSVVKKIRSGLDLCNIVPLRRQHSALNSLGLILRHLGNLAPELLPWLLKVLLVITSTSMTLLEKRDEVLPWCINLLKSVRTLAVMKLIQFFKTFPKYKFTPEEIDAVFESIVWPMLPRLELESVKMASPLLRLFCAWSENPRYFVLFSKYQEGCESLTILPHLITLYTSSRAKPRVVGVVSKIIFHLILSKSAAVTEEEEEEKVAPLKINFSLCEPEDGMTETGSITYGMKLLLPFVDNILQRLESTFLILNKKRSKKGLSQRDLTILLGISPHVENSEQCFKLIHLLVPFLHNPKTDVDPQVFILNTISNLIKKVKDVESFMELFAPLFGKLTNQNSRTALTSIFTTMAEENKKLAEMAVVINKVNAYDPNIIGEPDYQLRLEGHKEALDIIQSMVAVKGEINVHFIRIVIFNSAFMIRMLDDMALRNSSSSLLVDVIWVVSTLQDQKPEKFHLLIFETLLPEIQKGLKCDAEVKRHEFIYALSAVLDCCKDQPLLKELVALRHQDKDLDFWENIRHLQVHRRARALLRFSNALKNQRENKDKINFSYLLNYMIPIVQSFLFNEAYKKHVHVIDAAIETLGSIASVLSWHHYELLLKQYLDLISKDAEHHKTIVKIIVSLLDAFPFDLRAEKQESTDSTEDESSSTSPEMSKKINIAIRRNILPLLHKSLMKKSKSDDEHKLAGHYYPEDDEILRVPIALAMVKLLQKLPSGTMEKALPGLLLKMCELLKSRADSIRQTARETLIKMMQSLGPKYFYFLLKEMKGVMKKGYQIHVMIFTINAVLMNIADQLTCGDLDDCLKDLTEICVNELFSDVAEEKEVTKITGKVKEARSTKSYSILQILSKYISESLLMDLIAPLKELLFKKHSHKSLKKISECLRHIAVGLSENSSLSEKGLLVFIHAVIDKNVPDINKQKNKTSSKDLKYERPDIYLVPKEPGRSGPPAKISERTNIHILVEFGLQILQNCLKRDKLSKGIQEILQMLDPFVALLTQCLSSNQVKITTLALRCLLPFYKYPLPSFREHTKKVIESLFILINKYASPGMGQGENFEMIVMCFKMLTVLVRDTNYHKFTEDQLHSLLSYVEQDIYDYTRQATAFSLLKAILSKKIESPELPGIMSKIAEMVITSEQENVRAQCRQLCMQYMLDYPLGKKLIKSISFFIAQLEYPHEHGRVSCMEIINSMMNMFPENILKQHAALFLVPLSARLVNDESSPCRKMAAQCIKKLLEKVNHDGRAGLFSLAINWLQAKKMSHKRLGAQVCGLFAEVEGEQFEHHLIEILPTYCELIRDAANKEVEKASDERCTDHFLYHLLNSLTKMFSFCQSVMRKPLHSKIFNEFWTELQGALLYPHMWVRLAVDQLFGLLLSSYSVEEVIEAVSKEDADVYINSRQKLRDLSADFSTQIQSEYLNEKLGEQVVRNLVYLSRVISALPKGVDDVEVTLSWMIRKMAREAKKEVAETPNISMRRKYVFLFIAGISHELGRDIILPHLNLILIPLCREVSDASKTASEELKRDAQEALDIIKTVVGVEDFSAHYALVQSALLKKKIKRKREKAQEAITDPEKYSKRKIKKQQSKKESKKRKILQQKGRRKPKKAKLADIVIAS